MDIVSAVTVIGVVVGFVGGFFLKSHFFEKSKFEKDIRELREDDKKLRELIISREDKLREELKEEINRVDDKIMAAEGWKLWGKMQQK